MNPRKIISKFSQREARVALIGLGYVGLPLCIALAKVGYEVIAIDRDPFKVTSINKGISYLKDVDSETLKALVDSGKIKGSDSYEAITTSDAVIVCVPTPLGDQENPDLSCVLSAMKEIARFIHPGLLISLESTTYPGTSRELILPLFSQIGLEVGEDYFLCFSPERIDPGNKDWHTSNIPKVIGGMTENCLKIGCAFYSSFLKVIVPVSSIETAEMVKILENSFRAVNIAFVNEMLIACETLSLDIWEIIEAAGTKPFGFMKFYPGPGVGGHCIPVDPLYFTWKLRQRNQDSQFISLSHSMNKMMPKYWVARANQKLIEQGKTLRESKILLLGVAYKKDVSDIRESPALNVVDDLTRIGVDTRYYDPFVPSFIHQNRQFASEIDQNEALLEADLAMILTNHSAFDQIDFSLYNCIVINTRGREIKNRNKVFT